MQLTIIGAGAIGGTIGAHMIRDGHDILLCDADAAHVAAINERGLTICGPVDGCRQTSRPNSTNSGGGWLRSWETRDSARS
jgi:ketopantoate reductase